MIKVFVFVVIIFTLHKAYDAYKCNRQKPECLYKVGKILYTFTH